MTTICAIGDSHLGYRHRSKLQRLLDFEASFSKAVDGAMEKKPDAIIFGGDMFHHPRPNPKSMRFALQKLMEAAEGTEVIVLIGNHEIEGALGTSYSPLFSDLHARIHVLSTESPHVAINIEGGRWSFHGFEFIRNPTLAERKLAEISEFEKSDVDVLCLHQAVEGYLSPSEIRLRSLRDVAHRYDLILLGHVHKHGRIKEISDATPAFYMGSTEHTSLGDWQVPCGFLTFNDRDFETPVFTEVPTARALAVREDMGRKSPEEINERTKAIVEENHNVKCLQINLTAEVDGDFLDISHDWAERYPEFTILDVNINPILEGRSIEIEKPEINEDLIEEYFQKAGLSEKKDLLSMCLNMFKKYGQ